MILEISNEVIGMEELLKTYEIVFMLVMGIMLFGTLLFWIQYTFIYHEYKRYKGLYEALTREIEVKKIQEEREIINDSRSN